MNQITQFLLLIFSLIYGLISAFLLKFNNQIFKNEYILKKITSNIFLSFNLAIIYILVLYQINKGIVHFYFILMYVIGFLLFMSKYVKFKKKHC